jgi:hypothetical protein
MSELVWIFEDNLLKKGVLDMVENKKKKNKKKK